MFVTSLVLATTEFLTMFCQNTVPVVLLPFQKVLYLNKLKHRVSLSDILFHFYKSLHTEHIKHNHVTLSKRCRGLNAAGRHHRLVVSRGRQMNQNVQIFHLM